MAAAQERGFLGPGPLQVQLAHALGFATVVEEVRPGAPSSFVDLGAGGGVPGLVLAWRWPESEAVLLEASERRCRALRAAVAELEWSGRVQVVCDRAEQVGRGPLRCSQPLVVARSFGPPAVTAECAAPLLRPGGLLVVSEPPPPGRPPGPAAPPSESPWADTLRWPPEPLGELGLRLLGRRAVPFGYQVLVQERPCPERFPRRVGIPAKRPLY